MDMTRTPLLLLTLTACDNIWGPIDGGGTGYDYPEPMLPEDPCDLIAAGQGWVVKGSYTHIPPTGHVHGHAVEWVKTPISQGWDVHPSERERVPLQGSVFDDDAAIPARWEWTAPTTTAPAEERNQPGRRLYYWAVTVARTPSDGAGDVRVSVPSPGSSEHTEAMPLVLLEGSPVRLHIAEVDPAWPAVAVRWDAWVGQTRPLGRTAYDQGFYSMAGLLGGTHWPVSTEGWTWQPSAGWCLIGVDAGLDSTG